MNKIKNLGCRPTAVSLFILLSLVILIVGCQSPIEPAAVNNPVLVAEEVNSVAPIDVDRPGNNQTASPAGILRYTTVQTDPALSDVHGHALFSHFALPILADGQVGAGASLIVLPPTLDFQPNYVFPSPTGDYMVLMQPVMPGGRPHVVNQVTGEVRTLFEDYSGGSFYGWHPDGRHFLFWIHLAGLWLIDAETLDMNLLSVPVGAVQGGAISPDGSVIAYMDYLLDKAPEQGIVFINDTGETIFSQLPTGTVSYLYPHAWSPDSTHLVYYGSCGTSSAIEQSGGLLCVLDTTTQNIQSLPLPYAGYEPVWSPDGQYIAATGFASQEAPCGKHIMESLADTCLYQGRSLYIADITTGEVKEVASGIAPVWSPDSSMLAFLSNRNGGPEIWTVQLDGSNPQQLTADGMAKSPYGQLAWLQEVEE